MNTHHCPYCKNSKLKRIPFIYKPTPSSNKFHEGVMYFFCWNCKRIIKVPIIVHVNWINTHKKKTDTDKIWDQS